MAAGFMQRLENARLRRRRRVELGESAEDSAIEPRAMLDAAGVHAMGGGARPLRAVVDRGRSSGDADRAAEDGLSSARADDDPRGETLQDKQIGDEHRRRRLSILPGFFILLGHDRSKIGGPADMVNGASWADFRNLLKIRRFRSKKRPMAGRARNSGGGQISNCEAEATVLFLALGMRSANG